ncbi:hypothetical protein [Halobacterium jilantaiense]|uniref:Uncharacterized protein n=1 Tax=Halobacterium jilantaiense TaxID=355548 RepID=A0A1I0PK18_9EURY|nr:hypothetical protein [Halobacterium jilantaiense]SEW14754.1 hypothetical protein SAMN04487945_1754 [Halobacterium jilantaiense]
MAVAPVARYTGSALNLVLAAGLLGIAALHATAGVPTAILPAVGGLGLLAAAVALAPVGRRRLGRRATARDDALLFVGVLVVAAASLAGFFALGVA